MQYGVIMATLLWINELQVLILVLFTVKVFMKDGYYDPYI